MTEEVGVQHVRRPEWVPFSHRYGIADPLRVVDWHLAGGGALEDYAAERWRHRHHEFTALVVSDPDDRLYVDPLFRCTCPGSVGVRRCGERASQEDRLCDPCREHCWAVDDAGKRYRLCVVYGEVTTG